MFSISSSHVCGFFHQFVALIRQNTLYLLRWFCASNFRKGNTWSNMNCVFILADVYNVPEEVKLWKLSSLVEDRTACSSITGPYLPVP